MGQNESALPKYRIERFERRVFVSRYGPRRNRDARMNAHAIEILENRRVLSFTPFGGDTAVPATAGALAMDMAVAGNGTVIIAALVADAPDARVGNLIAVRYAASGAQLGKPLTIATNVPNAPVSVSADAGGDAVIAFQPAAVEFVRISSRGLV